MSKEFIDIKDLEVRLTELYNKHLNSIVPLEENEFIQYCKQIRIKLTKDFLNIVNCMSIDQFMQLYITNITGPVERESFVLFCDALNLINQCMWDFTERILERQIIDNELVKYEEK